MSTTNTKTAGHKPGIFGALMVGLTLAGSLLGGAGLAAQGQVFAKPWEISFARIKTAMETRTYSMTQVRRVWESTGVADDNSQLVMKRTLIGMIERLDIKPPVKGGNGSADGNALPAFDLGMVNLESKPLSGTELAARRKEYAGSQRTMFLYHGFRVHDAALADKNYVLFYLGTGARVRRATYTVVVLPKTWDRSAWLLELDQETGYPLYQGEFDLTARLQSEVVVTKFVKDVVFPATRTWSKRSGASKDYKNSSAALTAAMPKRKHQIVPEKELPTGYVFTAARVSQAANSSQNKAVLVYTDGLEHLFCLQRSVPRSQLSAAGHRIYTYDNLGVAMCQFTHDGVEYRLMGGSAKSLLLESAKALYSRAVATVTSK